MHVRFVIPAGTRTWKRVYWDTYAWGDAEKSHTMPQNTCPRGGGTDRKGRVHPGSHSAKLLIGERDVVNAEFGTLHDYPPAEFPITCEQCGAEVPDDRTRYCVRSDEPGLYLVRHLLSRTLFAPPAGGKLEEIQPGDLYYATWYGCTDRGGTCVWGWTNCDGRHLTAMLPNRDEWDINSRASNCTQKNEKTHRCWVLHGRPELGEVVHVDKAGHTCGAGAGSILSGGYHGFLHNNEIHEACKPTCGRRGRQ